MLRRPLHCALFGLSALASCATGLQLPAGFTAFVEQSPTGAPMRLTLEGDRIVAAAVPAGPGALPPAVRTTLDATAPHGELLWQGREWGPRGDGFRVDKRYRDGAHEHVRSVLIAADGRVLERSHSVPLGDVAQNVLGKAMQSGPHVDEVRIVSGPEREEYWSCTVRSRIGRTFVVDVDLDGRLLRAVRRVEAKVDV